MSAITRKSGARSLADTHDLSCFDSRLAGFETATVSTGDVTDLLSSTHAPEKIREYREAMDAGAAFPPISVIRVGRRMIVCDGHKRLSACKERGMTQVVVEFWPPGRVMSDLARQSARSTRRLLSLVMRSAYDPESRRWLRRFYWDTVLHWRRFFVTLPTSLGLIDTASASAADTVPAGRVFLRLARECARFRGHLVLIAISLAALSGAQLYLTWIAKLWTDGPLRTGDYHSLADLTVRASITSAVLICGLFCSKYFLQSLNQRFVQELRDRCQRHLVELELTSIRRFQVGELMSRLFNDAGSLSQFVREILRRWMGESLVLLGALFMLLRLDWRLVAILAVAGPAVAAILGYGGQFIRRRSAQAQREVGQLNAVLTEQLLGLTTIKSFQTERLEQERFAQKDSMYRHQVMRSQFWMATMTTAVWAVTCAALIAVVWYGTTEVAAGRATAGAMLALCLYAVQTVEPVRRLSEVHGLLQQALAAAARVFEIIDLPQVEQEGTLALPAAIRGKVCVEGVKFRYLAGRTALQDLELSIDPCETVVIVAASGGGKSTIAKLMVRFIDPTEGRVTLDDIDIRQLRLSQLRRAVCVVEQEPFIFSGSLLENIRYGSFDAERRRVEDAIELAGLGEFVAGLPAGLDSHLAESGRDVSGGQYQRIALARAIVRDPAVLVLDEATGAVDSETEQAIFSRLSPWLAERTVLVMTHRLATVIRFPRAIVLSEGQVVGDGPPTELLRTCPIFARLFAEQIAPAAPIREHSALS